MPYFNASQRLFYNIGPVIATLSVDRRDTQQVQEYGKIPLVTIVAIVVPVLLLSLFLYLYLSPLIRNPSILAPNSSQLARFRRKKDQGDIEKLYNSQDSEYFFSGRPTTKRDEENENVEGGCASMFGIFRKNPVASPGFTIPSPPSPAYMRHSPNAPTFNNYRLPSPPQIDRIDPALARDKDLRRSAFLASVSGRVPPPRQYLDVMPESPTPRPKTKSPSPLSNIAFKSEIPSRPSKEGYSRHLEDIQRQILPAEQRQTVKLVKVHSTPQPRRCPVMNQNSFGSITSVGLAF